MLVLHINSIRKPVLPGGQADAGPIWRRDMYSQTDCTDVFRLAAHIHTYGGLIQDGTYRLGVHFPFLDLVR